ncbi:MAG: RluA family pseudouridine synthase [Lachnospiraceae bacterium]|nr:RluA family pseudouridine synthase [Lachnospiraceae bacterium]
MNRTITYQINAENAGIRVEQFLKRKSYSRQNLAQLKNPGCTLLNGSDCRLNQTISAGDTLEVRILENASSDIPPVPIPLSVLYEDEDILVVNKPAGLPMHPSRDNCYYSLANAVMYYYKNTDGFVFRCSNRLDRDTSGLTVIAKHSVSASILGSMVKTDSTNFRNSSSPVMEREYLAIVCGNVSPRSGTIDAPLSRKYAVENPISKADPPDIPFSWELSERSIERCIDFAHGSHAITHYQVLETKNDYTLVSVLLETGRTHQIRVHMAYLGFPLAGDYLYNPACRRAASQIYTDLASLPVSSLTNDQKNIKIPFITVPLGINGIARQALHAWRLRFPHPVTGKIMEFTAPVPEDMLRFGFEKSCRCAT